MVSDKEVKCDFTDMVNYMVDENNVWNPGRYIPNRTLNGFSFGQESGFHYQYCRGNAYAEGFVGNLKFMLFYSHLQGFQLHWTGFLDGDEITPHKILSFTPDKHLLMLAEVEDRVIFIPLSQRAR